MTDQKPKIITSFQKRLGLDTALRSLARADNDAELRQQAAIIAEKHGNRALTAMIPLLDTGDPQLRGGLGYVAASLNHQQALAILSAAARDQSLSDQARMSAITILERYLGTTPDPSMYAGMAHPEQIAMTSLHEVLTERRSDPLILLDYFQQLSLEPKDVVLTMARAASRLEGTRGVELLRMFGQDPFPPVAEEALQSLGDIPDPAAAAALQSLIPNLDRDRQALAKRSLQKLRLRGVAIPAAPALSTTDRCLASPPDSQGNQILVFLTRGDEAETIALLQVLIAGQEGLTEASGSYDVSSELLPPIQATGGLHFPEQDRSGPLWLEAPFDYGRRRVLVALERNWARGNEIPLAYRLLNPLLWRDSDPVSALETSRSPLGAKTDLAELLRHPALYGWHLESPRVSHAAQRLLTGSEAPTPEIFEQTIQNLLADVDVTAGKDQLATIQESLLAMEEWLNLAGNRKAARQAFWASRTLHQNPAEHPLWRVMIQRGLRLALINLMRGIDEDYSQID